MTEQQSIATATPSEGSALVLVNLQNCFFSGGSLGVPGADTIIPHINQLIKRAATRYLSIYATRERNPNGKARFKKSPARGAQKSANVQFHPEVRLPHGWIKLHIISNDTDDACDLSAFDAAFSPAEQTLFIGGLPTDASVKATVLDALKRRHIVYFIVDASSALNINPDDGKNAIAEMSTAGAYIITTEEALELM